MNLPRPLRRGAFSLRCPWRKYNTLLVMLKRGTKKEQKK
jgi:hypothetical protein